MWRVFVSRFPNSPQVFGCIWLLSLDLSIKRERCREMYRMYRMYRIIQETLHTRACAHAHTGVPSKTRYIRHKGLFALVTRQKGRLTTRHITRHTNSRRGLTSGQIPSLIRDFSVVEHRCTGGGFRKSNSPQSSHQPARVLCRSECEPQTSRSM